MPRDNDALPGFDLAGLQFARREHRPAPLVLEFVEVVLAVAPVAVQLGYRRRVHRRVVRDKGAASIAGFQIVPSK